MSGKNTKYMTQREGEKERRPNKTVGKQCHTSHTRLLERHVRQRVCQTILLFPGHTESLHFSASLAVRWSLGLKDASCAPFGPANLALCSVPLPTSSLCLLDAEAHGDFESHVLVTCKLPPARILELLFGAEPAFATCTIDEWKKNPHNLCH